MRNAFRIVTFRAIKYPVIISPGINFELVLYIKNQFFKGAKLL